MQQQETTESKVSDGAQIPLACPTKTHFPFRAVRCYFLILLAICSGLTPIRITAVKCNALVNWALRRVVPCCDTDWLTNQPAALSPCLRARAENLREEIS